MALTTLPCAAAAETVICAMADGAALEFVIDRSQFVDAVTPEEPIRRKVTVVRHGARSFPAEPFLIGDMRGFHAEGLGGTSQMFVMQPGGEAVLSNVQSGSRVSGRCEVRN